MAASMSADVLIRSRPSSATTVEYVVADAASGQRLGGPFASLQEALTCAREQSIAPGRILCESLDQRGRIVGSPMLLQALTA